MPHIHIGIATAAHIFMVVLLMGTLWHVAAMTLGGMDGTWGTVGRAMAFMY